MRSHFFVFTNLTAIVFVQEIAKAKSATVMVTSVTAMIVVVASQQPDPGDAILIQKPNVGKISKIILYSLGPILYCQIPVFGQPG